MDVEKLIKRILCGKMPMRVIKEAPAAAVHGSIIRKSLHSGR